mmetsp:Transcript_14144/g.47195  ORF Transcript_14144/g.47195 Transcript_14144/m.47195 type:complete len:605 (+) Transcript_14144:929-2743(+)
MREELEERRRQLGRNGAELVGGRNDGPPKCFVVLEKLCTLCLVCGRLCGEDDGASRVFEQGRVERGGKEERKHLHRQAALVDAVLARKSDLQRPPGPRFGASRFGGSKKGKHVAHEVWPSANSQRHAVRPLGGPDVAQERPDRVELLVATDNVAAGDVPVDVRVLEVGREERVCGRGPLLRVGVQQRVEELLQFAVQRFPAALLKHVGGVLGRFVHPPQHAPKGEHVRLERQLTALLLRGAPLAGLGQERTVQIRQDVLQSELRPFIVEQDDRRRIDVAVDQALRVQHEQRCQELARHGLNVPRRARFGLEPALQVRGRRRKLKVDDGFVSHGRPVPLHRTARRGHGFVARQRQERGQLGVEFRAALEVVGLEHHLFARQSIEPAQSAARVRQLVVVAEAPRLEPRRAALAFVVAEEREPLRRVEHEAMLESHFGRRRPCDSSRLGDGARGRRLLLREFDVEPPHAPLRQIDGPRRGRRAQKRRAVAQRRVVGLDPRAALQGEEAAQRRRPRARLAPEQRPPRQLFHLGARVGARILAREKILHLQRGARAQSRRIAKKTRHRRIPCGPLNCLIFGGFCLLHQFRRDHLDSKGAVLTRLEEVGL